MKLKLEVEPGETIQEACDFAQQVADRTLQPVEFEFNSVDLVAEPGGCAITLHGNWAEVKNKRHRVTSKY